MMTNLRKTGGKTTHLNRERLLSYLRPVVQKVHTMIMIEGDKKN